MKKEIKLTPFLAITLLMVIVLVFLEDQKHRKKIAELEEIIEVQKEEIKQLEEQEEVRQQKVKDKQAAQVRDKAIARKFLETWRKVVGRDAQYEKVVVKGGVMKVYFSDIYEATAFIAKPEVIARFALDYFLRETGRKTGTVEYYTPLKRKIFSISGDLLDTEIKSYDFNH